MPDALRAPFWFGGLSSMVAATFTNPIDVVKTRMQLQATARRYPGLFRSCFVIVREEGVGGLFKGLSPSLMREAGYSSLRIGLYEPTKLLIGGSDVSHGLTMPLWQKIASGGITGAIGSSVATPFDLYKVRLQGASGMPPYRSFVHFLRTVIRAEGVPGLWRGVGPTVQRAIILTGSELPAYDHGKHLLLASGHFAEGTSVHCAAAMFAGLVCAVATTPVDKVKTLYMSQPFVGGRGTLYRGTLDCAVKIVRNEAGLASLWVGFFPNWMRIGPHTTITFLILEKLRSMWGVRPV